MAAGLAAFAAGFRAAGLARAMSGLALMHVLLAIAAATAPSVARTPHGALRALVSGGFLAVLWLLSAAIFRAAARRDRDIEMTI